MNDNAMWALMEGWVDQCRAFFGGMSSSPYLDGFYEGLSDESVLKSKRDESVISSYEVTAEDFLARYPSDLAVRFAVLFPLREAGMTFSLSSLRPSPRMQAVFQRLIELCNPDGLTGLPELKFELHNTYLAGQWQRGDEILHRIAVIGAMGAAELSALRGHYMFLSVWGRRIEWELDQCLGDYPENHDCFWPNTLPNRSELASEKGRQLSLLRSFTQPELIEPGSVAHWILTAWATNPRSPKLINIWPQLDFSSPLVPPVERDDTDGDISLRTYIQNLYRDFETIAQPKLDQASVERLQHAHINLSAAVTMSSGLGSVYRPVLARALFSLGRFELACTEYEQLRELNPTFIHRQELLKGGYREEEENYQWEISFMAALCHKLAGDFEHAVQILEELRCSEIHNFGAAWWAAKWYTERGQYDKASELLEKELAVRFSPPDSWELSTILALGRISDSQQHAHEFAKRLARTNPDLQPMILGVAAQLWPNVARLSHEARDHWLYAAVQLHCPTPIPAAALIAANSAIREFGWILEFELKARVFDQFKNELARNSELRGQALGDSYNDWGDKFLKYIAGKSKDGSLSLGSMLGALEGHTASRTATHIEFGRFLETRFPRLLLTLPRIKTVNDYRDRTSHPDRVFDKATALVVADACRQSIDALCS